MHAQLTLYVGALLINKAFPIIGYTAVAMYMYMHVCIHMDGGRTLTIAASAIRGETVAIITGAPETSLCVGAGLSTSIGVSCTLIDVWMAKRHMYNVVVRFRKKGGGRRRHWVFCATHHYSFSHHCPV